MKFISSIIFSCAAAAGLNASTGSLTTQSPFLPNDYHSTRQMDPHKEDTKQTRPTHFILKGVAQLSGIYHFSIFDSHSQRSSWIIQGESFNGLTALDFDPARQLLSIRYNDVEQIIRMNIPDDTSLAVRTSVQTTHSSIVEEPPTANRRPAAFRTSYATSETELQRTPQDEAIKHPHHPFFSATYKGTAATTLETEGENKPSEPTIDPTTNTDAPTPSPTRFGIDQSRILKTW